ncbi:glycosyltransferase family 2 protein [Candidatus Omnitrophota bacterium]
MHIVKNNNVSRARIYDQSLPLVSVIIPYYNCLSHLKEALESCINNTYPEIEILIVDDCSDDPLTLESIDLDFKGRSVNILRNSVNRGPGYSRNVGIKKAKGLLISFLDADDIWFAQMVQKQVALFCADSAVVWVYTDGRYLIDGKIMKKKNSFYHGFHKCGFPIGREVNAYHLRGYNYMTFSSNMFKKSIFSDVGFFNEKLKVSEDWDLFVRIAEKFSAHAINESLMLYRICNKGRHFSNRNDYVDINEKILRGAYERQNLLPTYKKEFDRAVAVIYERAGIQRLNAGFNSEGWYFLFHKKTRPLMFTLRLTALRVLVLLPSCFYRAVLWAYDH